MNFRKAQEQDIPEIMNLIAQGIQSLKEQGSPQWQNGYGPTEQQVKQDIKNGNGYVLDEKKIVAYASLIGGVDPVYTAIEDGEWEGKEPYVSIHRVVVSTQLTGKGMARKMLLYLINTSQQLGFNDIRIDTYPLNAGMQKAIKNAGFTYRGKVNFPIPYGDRWAYQYLTNE
ncbi:GNAT family N-acetyltransferase [Tetragenococcus solitarius]|uniref:GNAT family N-acetyltransferase n=1 Tax=Tetragenococcus solitarius TaxID=71453 RepID=A0ABP6KQK1_9ENTE|nr:GNAT family protein [Tetragenococcus solitarius]